MNDLQAENAGNFWWSDLSRRRRACWSVVKAGGRASFLRLQQATRFGGRALLPPGVLLRSPLVVVGVEGTVVNPREGVDAGFQALWKPREDGVGGGGQLPRLPHRGSFHSPPQQRERSAAAQFRPAPIL